MYKIDLKDRKIIYELDLDSRQTYQNIAKKVGLSKDSVKNRIQNLKEQGIIRRFHTIFDVGKLGFISFRLYLKFQNTTPEKEVEIIDYLKKQPNITWIVSIENEFDLGMWIICKKVSEMNTIWKEISEKYTNFIDKKWLTIFTRVSYFPRTYLLNKKNNLEEYVFITEPDEVSTDNVDLEILKLLSVDARISILDIAKKAGVTPKTVASRVKQLENKKVIIGYRTMFDLKKLGYQYFKIHINLHNITPEKIKSIRTFVKQHPYIIYDNEVLGGDDIEIEAQVESLNDLRKIIEELKTKFSEIIREYRYMNFYKEHKFVFFPA